jgi:restriction system protein
MQGKKSAHLGEAIKGNFIGADFNLDFDLSGSLYENWREFNKKYIPIYISNNPGKTKISAGLACGMLWTISKGIQVGDIVLSPDSHGNYHVAEVVGNYEFHKGEVLPHRRTARWNPNTILRESLSEQLRNSAGSIGTVSNISKYSQELNQILSGNNTNLPFSLSEEVESPTEFALEKHLEDFLVSNWKSTDLGKRFDLYEEDGEVVGQQYPSDTGPIDILALSKDKKEIVVIELKKGRVSDVVVGQIQRYMGYVKEELADKNQTVKGVIIGLEDDIRIRRALSIAPNIEFYTYKVHFSLERK